jgi:hypothetical protein
MKVKELIEILQGINPEKEVEATPLSNFSHQEVTDVREELNAVVIYSK